MNDTTLKSLLSDLVRFYPVTSDQTRVLELLKYVQKHLDQLDIHSKITTTNGVHMLYASTQDVKTSKIMLQSHIDVVPANEDHRNAVIDGDILRGRGSRDMLFAAAMYLHFLYQNKNLLSSLDVSLLLSGDEEVGGINTVPIALSEGYKADVVFLPDAGNKPSELVVSAKGVFNFDITVHGVAHHGSRPWEGDGAAAKLIKLLSDFSESFPIPSNEVTTHTIAQLEAGDSMNKGPATARAHIDIRYTNSADLQHYEDVLKKLCKKYDATLSNVIREPNYSVDTSSPLIQRYVAINKELTGKTVEQVSVSGSSDARYFSEYGIPVIMSRPVSGGSHSDNEWISLTSLNEFYKIMEQYILDVATIGNNHD